MLMRRAELTPSTGKNKAVNGNGQRWQMIVDFGRKNDAQSVMEKFWQEEKDSDTFIWRLPWKGLANLL